MAISQAVKAEGVDLSPEQAKVIILSWRDRFCKACDYLETCKMAVEDPGLLVNPWGRGRAFAYTSDHKVLAGMQREALNFNIQSTVADAMSKCLINFYQYQQDHPEIPFKIILSIHDAVLTMCPAKFVGTMIKEVIPHCMVDNCEVPGIGLKYSLGDFDISTRWGEKSSPEELLERGVPREYCGFKA